MKELKQEIIITVTETDFKRHNPKLDIDEMRLHTYAEQAMYAVQARINDLHKYYTCISTEPAQEKKSPWIRITPETLPEDTDKPLLVINAVGTMTTVKGFVAECDTEVWLFAYKLYMPIILPEEKS